MIILKFANKTGATHFHGSDHNKDKLHLQMRVWNLLNKGEIFSELVQHSIVMKVFAKILGKNFILGSFAANKLLPGAPGQEPHVDYPYWDMHDPKEFPLGINSSFHMNCQSLFALHDFTKENGATALVPYSQKEVLILTLTYFLKNVYRWNALRGALCCLLVCCGIVPCPIRVKKRAHHCLDSIFSSL